jgi:hypothetical protein
MEASLYEYENVYLAHKGAFQYSCAALNYVKVAK